MRLKALVSGLRLRTVGVLLFLFSSAFPINSSLSSTIYPDLPIHAFGITESKVSIIVDREILVPSLTNIKLSDADIAQILPYKGSAPANELKETLKSLQGVTLGHTLPYIYIAINHALNRIFQNRLIAERELEPELRELGIQQSDNSKLFANFRDLVRASNIKGAKITVELYTVRENFEQATERLNIHSAQAFWSPDQKTLGLYINGDNLYWLPYQADWAGQTVEDTILQVRDYVARLVLSQMGHETFHFVQSSMQYPPYSRPFLAEASAVFIEDNLSFREESSKIADAHLARGLSLLPRKGSPCEALHKLGPPVGTITMRRIERGARSSGGTFDLEKAILMGDAEFYGQTKSDLQTHYDLSAAFMLFVAAMPREEFVRRFGPVISEQAEVEQRKALSGLNEAFSKWLAEFSSEWWGGKNSEELYRRAKETTSRCMGSRDYVSALMGTRLMAGVRPRSVTSLVYAGDIFLRLEIPFFALDYYGLALAQGKRDGFSDEPEVRVASRLGEAYESLGDLRSALRMFHQADETQTGPLDLDMLMVVLRSRLKAKFYDVVVDRGQGQSRETKLLIDAYVRIQQLGGCPTAEERKMIQALKQALSINQAELFKIGLEALHLGIANRMSRDLKSGTIPELLNRQIEACR